MPAHGFALLLTSFVVFPTLRLRLEQTLTRLLIGIAMPELLRPLALNR